MRIIDASDTHAVDRLLSRDTARDPAVVRAANRIITDVRRRGDRAVRAWTDRLDGEQPGPVELTSRELKAGWAATAPDVRRAIRRSLRHVETVAGRQRVRPFSVDVALGVRVEQRVAPLGRVGCYVPAGRHPLPSTLLMTVGPARVAGVPDITVVCPRPAPAVLCAALEAGATRVLRIGGAQAIAALAYGTETIARVDKIVGPGNAWVAAAKSLVAADCAIDLHAGPSEIVVWSDEGAPEWIAADLIAQAEHDPSARALFVTTRRRLAASVAKAVRLQLRAAPAARAALRRHGAILVARSRTDAWTIVNRIAPEHLVCDRATDVRPAPVAGAVFVGPWSAQACGDYATGANHVLPTGGAARARGGLTAADFVRVYSVQTLSRAGLRRIAPVAATLAEAEGLTAHARSVRIRL